MTIRILIADDHSVVREGLRLFLTLDPELEVVAEAENGADALKAASQLKPDVVLMDLSMPEMDGIQATAAIRRQFPETEVLVLTSSLDSGLAVEAVRAGAIGYLLKDTKARELCRAVKAAAAGQVQLSPQAAVWLLKELRDPIPVSPEPEPLTNRENEVLSLLAQGKANKEIADILSIADRTVKTHVSSILAKLGMQSRTQAALYASRMGLIPKN